MCCLERSSVCAALAVGDLRYACVICFLELCGLPGPGPHQSLVMGGSYARSGFHCSRRAEFRVTRASGRSTGGVLIRCALGGLDRAWPSARACCEAHAAHRIVCRRRRSSRRPLLWSFVGGTMIRPPHAMGAFEFAVVAALRAVQLARGCRPRVDGDHTNAVLARLEVAEGKVTPMANATGEPPDPDHPHDS
jgi:hypothetical protein